MNSYDNSSIKAQTELNFIKASSSGGYNAVEFGSEISSIGSNAFNGCAVFNYGSPIKAICMPSVSSIGSGAFLGCASITSVELGSSPTSIGPGAFLGCANLTLPTFGLNFSSIGRYAFGGCAKLTPAMIYNIVLSGAADTNFKIIGDGTTDAAVVRKTIDTNNDTLSYSGCLAAGALGLYSHYVSGIGSDAFEGCASITSVELGSSPTSIGSYAFNGCANLKDFLF